MFKIYFGISFVPKLKVERKKLEGLTWISVIDTFITRFKNLDYSTIHQSSSLKLLV